MCDLNTRDDDIDRVELMIVRTGCLDQHNALIDCMAEHHDWRICRTQVGELS
jgi:hypothetical protein